MTLNNNNKLVSLVVTEEGNGMRMDKYLCHKLTSLSRNYIQKLIKKKAIMVNEKFLKPHSVIKTGDVIIIELPEPEVLEAKPQKIHLEVVYEDKNLIVIDKPSGMVVHPSRTHHRQNTLVNALLHHCKDLSGMSSTLRPGIVHRLDKDTSGLLVVAKNDQTHNYLSNLFKKRLIHKVYLALVKGSFPQKTGMIDAPLSRSFKDRKKFAVSLSNKAKSALTKFKVIKELSIPQWSLNSPNTSRSGFIKDGSDEPHIQPLSLLKVFPITGRTHQIRVHLSSIHHPIVGDLMYGDSRLNTRLKLYGLTRLFLHAHRLRFKLPGMKAETEFIGEISTDLKEFLKNLSE